MASAVSVGAVGAVARAATADDVTPPTGTVTIGDGSGWASSTVLTVHDPATDDVGVVSIEIFVNGVPAGSQAYDPTITVTVPQDSLWDIGIRWVDAAGNSSTGHAQVQVDSTPPEVQFLRFFEDPNPDDQLTPATIGNAWDDGSPITNVRFRTNAGPWGAPLPATTDTPMVVDWPAFDPTFGGSATIGPRTVSVQVQNAAGLWSQGTSEQMYASIQSLAVSVTGDIRTGHLVTITPNIPDGLVVTPGGCDWEFRWGNDKSLDALDFDETFGGLHFMVPGSAGGCGPWTLKLPWVPVRQFDVTVEIYHFEPDGGQVNGPRAHARFTAGVDSTERRILSSNLPIAQVLPSTYTPIVGQPITYTRYLIGGASSCCGSHWTARLGKSETPKQWTQVGGSTFTFTPTGPGDLFVGWDRTGPTGLLLSGYYDPPVRYRDTTPPVTTSPVQHLGTTSISSSAAPLAITWSGSDRGWGIKSYQLQRSLNGGAWASVALSSPTAKVVGVTAAPGSTLRFRVRAIDKAGHIGSWAYGPTFKVVVGSDSNVRLRYGGSWTVEADPTALGGSLHRTARSGASASYTVTGRDFAWIAARGPGMGKARVYVDGVLRATIDLWTTSPLPRRIVYRIHWSTLSTHTVRIVNLATATRPAINVDGLAILR